MSAATQARQRLCIVTPAHSSRANGGAEFQIDCLLEVLASQHRFEIFYVTSRVAPDQSPPAYRIVQVGDSSRPPRFGYLTYAPQMYAALRELQPQVIYQRVACGYSGVAAHYALRNGARFLWHVAHDSDVEPDASLEGRNPIRRYLEKRSVEYGLRHADCIVAQTSDQARLLERHYQRTPDAIIPNFHPWPSEPSDKSGPLTVAWIASVKKWKQPQAFVQLAQALRDVPDVRFVMAGPMQAGPGNREWATGLLREIAATPNLEYLGELSQSEVNRLLARAHVFVNTSEREGFPNTFIQAWMRDAAVVSLNVDPEGLLSRQGMGICCFGSRQNMVESVRALLSDRQRREDLAGRARVHARSKHSLRNAQALVDLFAGPARH
ncbi:MAG TPA: glycosyltransferase [Steroidobacteraceae bacterium]|nr:glycosyltransferase [Steroidobacteraceae bacterium]